MREAWEIEGDIVYKKITIKNTILLSNSGNQKTME